MLSKVVVFVMMVMVVVVVIDGLILISYPKTRVQKQKEYIIS
jgi:hypothetical protein